MWKVKEICRKKVTMGQCLLGVWLIRIKFLIWIPTWLVNVSGSHGFEIWTLENLLGKSRNILENEPKNCWTLFATFLAPEIVSFCQGLMVKWKLNSKRWTRPGLPELPVPSQFRQDAVNEASSWYMSNEYVMWLCDNIAYNCDLQI